MPGCETGGHKKNLGEAWKLYLSKCKSVDQTKKMKTKKKVSVQQFPQNLLFIWKIIWFTSNFEVKTKKKGLHIKKYAKIHKIRCESTKFTKRHFLLTNSRAISTILRVLGLDLHSSSPVPVNFFGAQSLVGGHNFRLGGTTFVWGAQAVIWEARPRNSSPWCRAWLNFESYTATHNKYGFRKLLL